MDGAPYAGNALTFLVHVVFGVYILVLMLRVLLQLFRADYYNPLSQFTVRLTEPVLAPIRRLLPRIGGVESGALAVMLAAQMIELRVVYAVQDADPSLSGLAVVSVAELLSLCTTVFFWSILIRVILSWVNPGLRHPATDIVHSLTEPVLAPARRLLPTTGGFDLSPIFVLIGLQLVNLLLIDPIRDAGRLML